MLLQQGLERGFYKNSATTKRMGLIFPKCAYITPDLKWFHLSIFINIIKKHWPQISSLQFIRRSPCDIRLDDPKRTDAPANKCRPSPPPKCPLQLKSPEKYAQ